MRIRSNNKSQFIIEQEGAYKIKLNSVDIQQSLPELILNHMSTVPSPDIVMTIAKPGRGEPLELNNMNSCCNDWNSDAFIQLWVEGDRVWFKIKGNTNDEGVSTKYSIDKAEFAAELRAYMLNRDRPKVYFSTVREQNGFLTTFAHTPIQYQGLEYRTAEHLFQALKYLPNNPSWAETIRLTSTPTNAKFLGDGTGYVINRLITQDAKIALRSIPKEERLPRPDWDQVADDMLLFVTRLKAEQWSTRLGIIANHDLIIDRRDGQNKLGAIWMQVRDELGLASILSGK